MKSALVVHALCANVACSNAVDADMVPTSGLRDVRHPVWRVYDEYRTVRLTIKYYCHRSDAINRKNLLLEVVVALAASGSALAGFTVWNTNWGKPVWQLLATIAAALAVAKPVLKYDKEIGQLQEVISGYRFVEHRLKTLAISIEQKGCYDHELRLDFEKVLGDLGALSVKDPIGSINERFRRRYREEVERELPAGSFFIPPLEERTIG